MNASANRRIGGPGAGGARSLELEPIPLSPGAKVDDRKVNWRKLKLLSPASRLIRSASDPFDVWTAELTAIWPDCAAENAASFWSLISAIYALTDEEKTPLRATEAYGFAGGSATTGKRKLLALIEAGLVRAVKNSKRRNEKFIHLSAPARDAVLKTLDHWSEHFAQDAAAYRKFRKKRAVESDGA